MICWVWLGYGDSYDHLRRVTYIWERLLLVRGVFHTCMYGCERNNQNGVESVVNIHVGKSVRADPAFRPLLTTQRKFAVDRAKSANAETNGEVFAHGVW